MNPPVVFHRRQAGRSQPGLGLAAGYAGRGRQGWVTDSFRLNLSTDPTQLATVTITAQLDSWRGIQSMLERAADRPWATAVELLVIGCTVFGLLRLLQGTRGARLVRAVFTILAISFALVYLVAEQFGFERIIALYPYFVLGVFLVSLVAFQTELRRILSRLGEGGWLRRWLKAPPEAIAPIVTAVGRMAEARIGALMAIERSTELGSWSESGVRLDAVVSAELLQSIFRPGSPLHDLGVIIDQGRIVAAGCQFPLAESTEVDRALGSRHRAAIGMSQEVDAVVLVVSEETGTVSVAIRGQLQRGLSPSTLREILAAELNVPAAAKKRSPPESLPQTPPTGQATEDGTGQAA